MSMTIASELLEHVRAEDEQAEAAVGALVAFFEQASPSGPTSDWTSWTSFDAWQSAVREQDTAIVGAGGSNGRRQWDDAVTRVMEFLTEEPEHPSLVFALGKSNDPRIKPLLRTLIRRFADDGSHEELLWQSLIALTNFDDVDDDVLEAVAGTASSERARSLARRRLELGHPRR
jgi:hypothetical protein